MRRTEKIEREQGQGKKRLIMMITVVAVRHAVVSVLPNARGGGQLVQAKPQAVAIPGTVNAR